MFIADVRRIVEQVSRDKGINTKVLLRALEEALRSAARKKFGARAEVEVNYNSDSGEIEVFRFKEVVKEVFDSDLQISLKEAVKLDAECKLGDSLGSKIDISTFGRIAAQSAKQVIIQKMKDAERDAVYSGYIDRKGEIINGIVQRIDRGNIIVNLGTTEGILRSRDQIPGENYGRGDRIRALIMDILYDTKGPQIVLSRSHSDFLVSLFRTEVPEISEGIVDVRGATREPGIRAKFAVSSNDLDIDPVGACVGIKGSRVQNVVQELKGEKIDIVTWHVDSAKYVCNSLAPAEIIRVIIDEENHSMEVVVPDEFLSVAIGKRGQNVKLASRLTGWKLDVSGESAYDQLASSGYKSLINIPGVDENIAASLVEKGISSVLDLATADLEDLAILEGMDEENALCLIKGARACLEISSKNKNNLEIDRSTSRNLSEPFQNNNDFGELSADEKNCVSPVFYESEFVSKKTPGTS